MAERKAEKEVDGGLTEADLAGHELSIRRYLSGMLRRDELEDATQTVLQRGLENLTRFRGDSSPRVWLLGIARNVGLEVARARQKEVGRTVRRPSSTAGGPQELLGADLLAQDGPDQEEQLGRKEQQALALTALDGLPLDDKLALLVTYVDGLPGPMAAEVLDISFAAFRQRLSRARQALRKRLGVLMESGTPGDAEVMRQWQALLDPQPRRPRTVRSDPENPGAPRPRDEAD